MAITVTHTFELVCGTPEEYTVLLSQVASYVSVGLNPGEVVISQVDDVVLQKVTLVIQTVEGAL